MPQDRFGGKRAHRALGTWPAVSVFTAACLWTVWNRYRFVRVVVAGLCILQMWFVGRYLFRNYPKHAFEPFHGELRAAAESGNMATFAKVAKAYDSLEVRYHLVRSFGHTCQSSEKAARDLPH